MPVFDTSFVIDVFASDPQAIRVLGLLQKDTRPMGVTTFTHYELYSGVGRSKRPDAERTRVEAFLRELGVFDMTPEAAKLAGLLDARLAIEGKSLRLVDLFIAATALHHGEAVVTRNKREFSKVPGLEVIAY